MVSSTTGHRKPMFEKHWCTKWVPRVYQMGTTRSERVRAQRRVTAEQQEQEAAETAAQEAPQETERLRAELQTILEEKERLRSEVAGLKQDAFEAKRRRLAADAAAQQATVRVYQMATTGVPNGYRGCTKCAPRVY